jgi:beta-lactamase class A
VPPHSASDSVFQQIDESVRGVGGRARAAVAWQPLNDAHPRLSINAAERFHAASLVKVPAMVELFRRVSDGTLHLDDTLLVTNRFESVAADRMFELSPDTDTERDLYDRIGSHVTLELLCELMITRSSNLAANNLIRLLGAERIQLTMDELDVDGVRVVRCVEDDAAHAQGINNLVTAKGLLTLFTAIGTGRAINASASTAMTTILARQQFTDGIPSGLPAGTRVAHKTGTTSDVHHDGGLVLSARPYALVVLTAGIADRGVSAGLIADIARTVDRFAETSV